MLDRLVYSYPICGPKTDPRLVQGLIIKTSTDFVTSLLKLDGKACRVLVNYLYFFFVIPLPEYPQSQGENVRNISKSTETYFFFSSGILPDSLEKCGPHDIEARRLSLSGSSGFVVGKTLQSPNLVIVEPMKYISM